MRLRVMTPLAAQGTALQEDRCPYAGAVMGAKTLDVEHTATALVLRCNRHVCFRCQRINTAFTVFPDDAS